MADAHPIANAIRDVLTSFEEQPDGTPITVNLVDAIYRLAESLDRIANRMPG